MSMRLALILASVPPCWAGAGRGPQPDMDHIWKGEVCSHLSSEGPADADVEVTLGGLPASSATDDAYLQWWAARKSPTDYNATRSPVNCSIYENMVDAYPKYTDPDFNGGNVRISETGEARIRFRAPATYYIWRMRAMPHVHFRVCHRGNRVRPGKPSLMLAGSYFWVSERRNQISVISAGPYAEKDTSAVPESSQGRIPIGVVDSFDEESARPPAPAPSRGGKRSPPRGKGKENPTNAAQEPDRKELISKARRGLDLDALEFSPVYSCLLQRQFYDHFTSACVQECPDSSVVARGQCARAATPDPLANLRAVWRMSLQVDEAAWGEEMNVSLHNVRLSVAGVLDVPFQEVDVSVSFEQASDRRLADEAWNTVTMTVNVVSDRVSVQEGNRLLASFGQDATALAEVLGFEVRSVELLSDLSGSQGNLYDDPYAPAYNDVERISPSRDVTPQNVLDFLPTEAILGILATLFLLFVAFVVYLIRRRRRLRIAQQSDFAENGKVIGKGNDVQEIDISVRQKH